MRLPHRLARRLAHPRRWEHLRRIRTLDPAVDYDEIVTLTMRHEFPWDYVQGAGIAFMRDYGVPSIARLLDRTGEFEHDGVKRYDDTLLIGEEAGVDGLDSPHGHATVRRLNRIHGHYDIPNDEFAYVLATTIVGPVRWIDEFGWRDLDPVEVEAFARFTTRFGELMGIRGLPTTYEGYLQLLLDYERERFAFDPANTRVAEASLRIAAATTPGAPLAVVRRVAISLMDEPLRDGPRPAPAAGLARPRGYDGRCGSGRSRCGSLRRGPSRSRTRPRRTPTATPSPTSAPGRMLAHLNAPPLMPSPAGSSVWIAPEPLEHRGPAGGCAVTVSARVRRPRPRGGPRSARTGRCRSGGRAGRSLGRPEDAAAGDPQRLGRQHVVGAQVARAGADRSSKSAVSYAGSLRWVGLAPPCSAAASGPPAEAGGRVVVDPRVVEQLLGRTRRSSRRRAGRSSGRRRSRTPRPGGRPPRRPASS